MLRFRRLRALSILLCALWVHALLPSASWAQIPAAPAEDPRLDEARDLIKTGEYGRAIEILGEIRDELRGEEGPFATGEATPDDAAQLREAYLLLIKTHEYLGIDAEAGRQGIAAAEPYYRTARELIEECLRVPGLQHTRAEPASEFPDRMHEDFDRVRNEIFGAFRITSLDPPDASVELDGVLLEVAPVDSLIEVVDLLVDSPHVVWITREGYKEFTEELVIEKGTVLAKPYALSKKRGKAWYAEVGTGAAAVAGGIAYLIASGSDGGTTPPPPLPGPPDPPSD